MVGRKSRQRHERMFGNGFRCERLHRSRRSSALQRVGPGSPEGCARWGRPLGPRWAASAGVGRAPAFLLRGSRLSEVGDEPEREDHGRGEGDDRGGEPLPATVAAGGGDGVPTQDECQ